MKNYRTLQGSTLSSLFSTLSSQLALGFTLVTLLSTLTVALVANATADVSFRGSLAQAEVAESGIVRLIPVIIMR